MSTVAFSRDSAPLQSEKQTAQSLRRGVGSRSVVGSKHSKLFFLSRAGLAVGCVGGAVACLLAAPRKGLLHDGGATRKANRNQAAFPPPPRCPRPPSQRPHKTWGRCLFRL
eukprot:GHVT01066418.1.p2 GENE.GHVT01066418.1~~GHVT01066418.1.p2  ORF type:complete len:111 (+),score=25.68 GHVT01066418.1:289-621(+)